jgi:cytochrome c-type biogenesis protein CcmH/NrfF
MAPSNINIELNAEQNSIYSTIVGKVMSPYCPGKILSDCPTEKAAELKLTIKNQIISGSKEQQIIEYLESEYGKETISSMPTYSGFGGIAWVTPFLFLVIGGVLLIKMLKSWSVENNISDVTSDSLESKELEDILNRAKKDLKLDS